MVEPEIDDQTLIEVPLGVRVAGGDRMRVIAHAVEQRRPCARREFVAAVRRIGRGVFFGHRRRALTGLFLRRTTEYR